jgi:catechol 2,3-dioxygenase
MAANDMGNDDAAATPARLPDRTHVGRVDLQVRNLTESLAYYRNVIGLHVLNEVEALLGTEDGRDLVRLHERPNAQRVPHAGVLGLYHFALLLPDRASLGRFIRHVTRLGIQFGSADHLVSEATYLWDPDGLGIEVYADRPRQQWLTRAGELVMSSDPLDFESLIDSAGDQAWQGLPAGTTMGHIHLQVGDLDGAREFYHAVLGLDIVVSSFPGALFLSAGGYHHHVGVNTWARRARPPVDNDAQLLEWRLVLPAREDVDAVADRARAAGHAVATAGADRLLADPWGTRLRLTRGHGNTGTRKPRP